MARRTREHITGDRAQSKIIDAFEDADYACNGIAKDYGEDFFVVTHEDSSGIVEPFRIFVQSKGTLAEEKWREYVDPFTVRNWITSNELVIVVKRCVETGEMRYCVPEDEIDYFDIHPYILCSRDVPIVCDVPFNRDTPRQIVWRGRIRHYERMVRLCLPDNECFREVPKAKLLLSELFGRCGLLDKENFWPSDAALGRLDLITIDENRLVDQENFTVRQQVLFQKWLMIIAERLDDLAPGVHLSRAFIEHGAILMQAAGFNYGLDRD